MVRKTKAGTFEVDHYYFDTEGKRRRKLKTFPTHKEAVAYQKEALAAVEKKEFVAPSKATVGECAKEWLRKRFASGNYERATRIERENHVHGYIISSFGALPIQSLNVQRIEKELEEWNKRVSAMVVNRVLRTLTNIMAEAKRYGLVKDNPAAEAIRLKEESEAVTVDKIFSRGELRRVINARPSGTVEKIMLMLPALTGIRVGELLGASWNDVDLKAGKLTVRTATADSDKGQPMIFKKPKNQHSQRTIPISKELVTELRLWKIKCPHRSALS